MIDSNHTRGQDLIMYVTVETTVLHIVYSFNRILYSNEKEWPMPIYKLMLNFWSPKL